MGLLIAGLLAVVIYYVYQNTINHSSTSEQASDVTTITGDTIQADTVTRSLAVPIDTTAKPKPKATIPVATTAALAAQPGALAGNLTQQMTPYLSNPALPKGRAFPLAGLAYYPGSLSMTAGSQAVVGELATLLKTHPQLQIQLVGYANDAQRGITNKSLSFKRVNQIKQQLMTSGIDFVRIDALGRGTGVARNDTSTVPKPTLRKIIVKVVVK
jgi:outer membrane protein OmpA-like peptidoglycan-associated protein